MIAGDPSAWDDFFQQDLLPAVLDHLITTWHGVPKPGPADLEADISLKLYCALVTGKDRSRHHFLIRYEDVEVDTDLVKHTGRKDIVFYPSTLEEVYLCVEAKRLNVLVNTVRRSLADEYVKEGMQRFVDRKYSRHVRHGAMVAYVLDADVPGAMTNVLKNIRSNYRALRMKPPGDWTDSRVRPSDPHMKETAHERQGDTAMFRLHHIFVSAAAVSPTAGSSPRSRASRSRSRKPEN